MNDGKETAWGLEDLRFQNYRFGILRLILNIEAGGQFTQLCLSKKVVRLHHLFIKSLNILKRYFGGNVNLASNMYHGANMYSSSGMHIYPMLHRIKTKATLIVLCTYLGKDFVIGRVQESTSGQMGKEGTGSTSLKCIALYSCIRESNTISRTHP